MLFLKKKLSYQQRWYLNHKQRLSAKRKKLYAENPEYRQQALEASRKYRKGQRTPAVPGDAPISFAEAAKKIDVGRSTLREWRRQQYFPEPMHYNGRLWFSENQLSLLKDLKDFLQKYRMRPGKIKQERWKELHTLIFASW